MLLPYGPGVGDSFIYLSVGGGGVENAGAYSLQIAQYWCRGSMEGGVSCPSFARQGGVLYQSSSGTWALPFAPNQPFEIAATATALRAGGAASVLFTLSGGYNFVQVLPDTTAVPGVPEPSTIVLLPFGGVVLLRKRTRRQRRVA